MVVFVVVITSILTDLTQCLVSALDQKNAYNMQCHKAALYEIENFVYVIFFSPRTQ